MSRSDEPLHGPAWLDLLILGVFILVEILAGVVLVLVILASMVGCHHVRGDHGFISPDAPPHTSGVVVRWTDPSTCPTSVLFQWCGEGFSRQQIDDCGASSIRREHTFKSNLGRPCFVRVIFYRAQEPLGLREVQVIP